MQLPILKVCICIQTQSFVRSLSLMPGFPNISFENTTEHLVYPNCPFYYCNPNKFKVPSIIQHCYVCGSCKTGLSLSLGSSRCLLCPMQLLACITHRHHHSCCHSWYCSGSGNNMTVAVSTINGLILYDVNRSLLLPYQEPNFVTTLLSSLNLELGIDSYYFEGIDTYIEKY